MATEVKILLWHTYLLFDVTFEDKLWVQQYLNGTDTDISTSANPANDLALRAACNGAIMSFSTFAWWVSFLAGGKTIYFKYAIAIYNGLR